MVRRALWMAALLVALGTPRARAQTAAPAADLPPPPPGLPSAGDGDEPSAREPAEEPIFRATARAPAPVSPGSRRFAEGELRDVPGSFGDPLRALDALPGVVPIVSGAPYVLVRGAPPAGTLHLYDDVPLPLLFHLGLGPAIVHPRMLGPLRLWSGAAPARYGRLVGGVITAAAPEARVTRTAGELELRLLDVNGYVEAPLPGGGEVRAAMRLGWPALIADAVYPGTELFYGDYQLRARVPLGTLDRVEVIALGSYDRLGVWLTPGARTFTEIQFHRVEARLVRRVDALEFGAALRAGYDRTELFDPEYYRVDVEAGSIAPRLWLAWREGIVRVRAGGDFVASFGKPRSTYVGGLGLQVDSLFRESSTRSTAGAYVELGLDPHPAISIDVGARIDSWMTGRGTDGAIDPRARLVVHAGGGLDLHVGGAVVRQPAVPYVPLPGLADVALSRGLQTAMQAEAGARLGLEVLELELQLFVHHYDDLVLTDGLFAFVGGGRICGRPGGACVDTDAEPRVQALSYGGELFLRIAPHEPLSGWISYTLAWSEMEPILGLPYRPLFDVRHVLSAVASWNVGAGFTLGARVFVRSGAPRGEFWVDQSARELRRHEQELDAFFRADAQVAYAWDAGWGRLRVSLEWMNLTIAEEPVGIDCPLTGPVDGRCPVRMAPPIFAPNLGIRAEL